MLDQRPHFDVGFDWLALRQAFRVLVTSAFLKIRNMEAKIGIIRSVSGDVSRAKQID